MNHIYIGDRPLDPPEDDHEEDHEGFPHDDDVDDRGEPNPYPED